MTYKASVTVCYHNARHYTDVIAHVSGVNRLTQEAYELILGSLREWSDEILGNEGGPRPASVTILAESSAGKKSSQYVRIVIKRGSQSEDLLVDYIGRLEDAVNNPSQILELSRKRYAIHFPEELPDGM